MRSKRRLRKLTDASAGSSTICGASRASSPVSIWYTYLRRRQARGLASYGYDEDVIYDFLECTADKVEGRMKQDKANRGLAEVPHTSRPLGDSAHCWSVPHT